MSELTALVEFASRTLEARFPLNCTWHPGDIIWELRGNYDQRQPIRLWESDGHVEAVAWVVGPGQLWLEATPSGERLVPAMITWAEARLRRDAAAKQVKTLSVRAFDADHERLAVLSRLSFQRAGPESVHYEFDLSQPVPDVVLPPGFAVRDCLDIDPEQRAASHRAAWSALTHIGIENARSTFSAATYQGLRSSPVYRADLDLVAVAPDGTLAANCIAWSDSRSGIGIFEPFGTHPEFRGRGLARALLAEGLRRLRDLGHGRARIFTAHFNTSAIAAYASLLQPSDHSSWWSKKLEP